jgi:hypothetical protein
MPAVEAFTAKYLGQGYLEELEIGRIAHKGRWRLPREGRRSTISLLAELIRRPMFWVGFFVLLTAVVFVDSYFL